MTQNFEETKANTQAVYEEYARQWDVQRPRRLYERKWLDRFVQRLPTGGSILDLGCGGGEPISQFLINQGFHITGVDYAQSMIDLAAGRFPDHQWLQRDMRNLDLSGKFDGVISWDGFFHLSQNEQIRFFNSLPGLLSDKATLLFTVGTTNGEVTGTVAGQTVYHASLSPDEYRKILSELDFGSIEIILEDSEVLGRSILFARR